MTSPTGPAPGDLLERLHELSLVRPAKVALADDREEVTYADLWRRLTDVSGRLRSLGLGPGRTIGFGLDPSAFYVTLLLGSIHAGATAAPINTRLSAVEVEEYASRLEPELILVDAAHRDAAPEPRRRLVESPRDLDPSAGPSLPLAGSPPRDGDAAFAFPTGGTTGTPKAALWSRSGLAAALESSRVELRVAADDVELYLSPFFHVTMVTGLLTTLYAGGCVHVMARFDAPEAAARLLSGEVTRLFGTPTVVTRILDAAGDGPHPEVGVKLVFGAARSVPAFVERLRRALPAAQLFSGYGATEFGAVTRAYPEDIEAGDFGVGRPVPGVEIRVVDPAGDEVEVGVVGEIVVSSPWAATGYRGGGEDLRLTPDGAICSGDLGHLDGAGLVHLDGRAREMIKTGGENVFPTEVEAALMAHPDVDDAAVFGVADDVWGERVEALVVPAPGSDLDLEALSAFCRSRLAGYKVPKALRRVDDLPYTPNMKLDRRRIVDWGMDHAGG